jgi:hypothetical protein
MRADAITTQPRTWSPPTRAPALEVRPTRAASPCGCGSRMVPDSVSSDDPSNSVRYAMSSCTPVSGEAQVQTYG